MRIKFTKNQWQRISELLGNTGIATLVSIVIPAVFDNLNLIMITLGLIVGGTFIYLSILSARKY